MTHLSAPTWMQRIADRQEGYKTAIRWASAGDIRDPCLATTMTYPDRFNTQPAPKAPSERSGDGAKDGTTKEDR